MGTRILYYFFHAFKTIVLLALFPSVVYTFGFHKFAYAQKTEMDQNQIVKKTKEAIKGIKRYRIKIERDEPLPHFSQGEIDHDKLSTHFHFKMGSEPPIEVEFYRFKNKAFGFPFHTGKWFQVQAEGDPISYINYLAGLIEPQFIQEIKKERVGDDNFWVLSVAPDLSILHGKSEAIAGTLYKLLYRDHKNENQILERIKEWIPKVKIHATFWISRRNFLIQKVEIRKRLIEVKMKTIYHFYDINDPKLEIALPAEALEPIGPPIPLGALFMRFDAWESNASLWGWSEPTHCMMTDEALRLIKRSDIEGKYKEVYNGYPQKWGIIDKPPYYIPIDPNNNDPGLKNHPCVVGAWAEDAWDSPRLRDPLSLSAIPSQFQTYRSNRHFGGEHIGLKNKWYFGLIGLPNPISGNYYISARNWAWNGGQTADKMNFQGAIEAYNNYTYDATKAAYRRIGHVLHLLQDIAQPDHAGRFDHAGSAMSDPQAFSKFKVCPIVVIEAGVIAAAPCAAASAACTIAYWFCFAGCIETAQLIALAVCEASIDDDEVGFEWLIREKWNFDRYIKDPKGDISTIRENLKIERQKISQSQPNPIFNYFKELQDYSLSLAQSKGKSLALGLDYIDLVPFNLIPGLNPEIEVNSQEADEFLMLADDLIIKGTNKNAGLLQYFFEICNHPPYVQEVVIYQSRDRLKIDKVAGEIFPVNPDAKPSLNIKYRGCWTCKYDSNNKNKRLVHRELKTKREPFEPDQFFYVLARVTSDMEYLILTLRNEEGDEQYKKLMTKLAPTSSKKYTSNPSHLSIPPWNSCNFPPTAYYGTILPQNALRGCGPITLEFVGEDLEAHYYNPKMGRTISGKKLDSNPVTIAVIEKEFPHNWINDASKSQGYEPGADNNHIVSIFMPDEYENNDSLTTTSHIKISEAGKNTYDLSFHNKNDLDFFSVEVPINLKCRGAMYPKSIDLRISYAIPSFFQICVESMRSDLLVTFFLDNGVKQYTFPKWTQCPKEPSPLGINKASFIGIEDIFPDGKIPFLVEQKPGPLGKKYDDCFSMKIWYGNCEIKPAIKPFTLTEP